MNNLKIISILKIIIPLSIIFLFNQCMHDEFEFNKLDDEMVIKAGVLSPVAYGSLTLENIISEFDSTGYISSDADGLLYLSYRDTLVSYVAEELLNIPTQNFFEFFIDSDFSIAGTPPAGTYPTDREVMFPFTFDKGERPDSMVLDSGELVFDITSSFEHQAQVQLEILNLIKDGVVFSRTFDISDNSGSFSTSIPFDLAGYTIHLQDSVGNDTMFFPVKFHVELYADGSTPINPTDQIGITANLLNLNFDAIYGYIGNYSLLGENGSVDLGFFDNPIEGEIVFAEPSVNFYITNSYGVPSEITINRFTGFNLANDSLPLEFTPPTANVFDINHPTVDEIGTAKIDTISINSDNSLISDFISFLPTSVDYNINAASNPDGELPEKYNFVTDDSEIGVEFEMTLPMYFTADSFALEETIDLNLLTIEEDAEAIEKVTIVLEVSNGLPIDIDFQLYFLDESYNIIDTLFSDKDLPVIEAAMLDTDNSVLAPRVKVSIIEYTNEDLNNLNTVLYGLLRAGLKTPYINDVQEPVKFYSDYSVDFNLSVGVDVKVNIND